jgi:DNA modification methylase
VPGDVFDMQYPYGPLSVRAESGQITYTCPLEVQERGTLVRIDEPIVVNVQAGDVFDFPRVTGNSAQRCDWHPTQLHEELVERCIKLSTADGDMVVDPFGGTGTTLRVCMKLKQPCSIIELDNGYCKQIAKLNGLKMCRSPGTWGKLGTKQSFPLY